MVGASSSDLGVANFLSKLIGIDLGQSMWAWQYSKSENITETKLEAQESACQISYSFLPNPSIVGPIVSEPNPNSLPYIVSQIPKPSSNRFRDLSVHSNRRTWLLAHSNAHRPPTNFQTAKANDAQNFHQF